MSSHSSSSQRPTLPPLHTLNLLPPSYAQQRRGESPYDSYDRPSCPRLNVPEHLWPYNRRASTSSSSRTPSPTPSDASSSASSSPTSPSKSKLTLIPSSFEDADAIVVIPPPGASLDIAPGAQSKPGQALLLLGFSLKRLHHHQCQIAKGTRMHPYRFAGDASCRTSRRPPISSSLSST
ncbi:hypothetical protein C8R43DRAFT_1241812 [Mycena crocata]|nr:hypothetical protein C8R43DRAFT_1241812 [Mycena crocata]